MFEKVKDLLLSAFTEDDWEQDQEGSFVYVRTIRWRSVFVTLACLWLAFAATSFTVWCIIHLSLKTILGVGAFGLTALSAAIVLAAVTGDL